MADYCRLPSEEQKLYAEYLGSKYGLAVKYRYLAVVCKKEFPNYGWFKGSAKSKNSLPQLDTRKVVMMVKKCHEVY